MSLTPPQKKMRICRIVDFVVPADNWIKLKESEKRDKYQDFAWELRKYIEHEGDGDTNCNWCTRNNPQRLGKGTGRLGNKRRGDHPDYGITKKSPGDLRTLAVT